MFKLGTSGVDNLNGGDGSDTFFMTANNFVTDTVNGGPGSDTIDYSVSNVGVHITLFDMRRYDFVSSGVVEADFVTTTYNPAARSYIQMSNHQVVANLTNIENAVGSAYDDVLTGNNLANVLNGGAGNDIIDGGYGADTIIGGAGHDTMTGGGGDDKFVFQHAADGPMSTAYSAMDTVTDFVRGEDKIDLHALVNETTGNHALSYIDGGSFTGIAGQVNSVFTGYGWLVKADLNGDRVADFQALVHSSTDFEMHQHLQASDFILV